MARSAWSAPLTAEEYLWAAFMIALLTLVASTIVGTETTLVFGLITAGVGAVVTSIPLAIGLIAKSVKVGVRDSRT